MDDASSAAVAETYHSGLHGHANIDLVRRESGLWGYLLALHEEPKGQYPSSGEALKAALQEPRLARFKPDQVRIRRVTDRSQQ